MFRSSSQLSTAAERCHWLQAPERILDAPDLTDDYYLNLLDWSSTNTVILDQN